MTPNPLTTPHRISSHRTPTLRTRLAAIALVAGGISSACGGSSSNPSPADSSVSTPVTGEVGSASCTDAGGSITIYSGRNENLVGELLSTFTSETGIEVEARYGDSGELAGQILTEGSASPADVFFSQDAGALGAVSRADLFMTIDDTTLSRVPESFRSTTGDWIGTSGRVRVVIYNPELVAEAPTTIDELVDPQWKGRIGFAPTNASWQSFVTALRVLRGEDEARRWLEAFKANDPVAYEKNAAIRDAVDTGDIALGLVNHYYLYEKIAAEGADAVVAKNQFLAPGDPGGLVNVAGAGILESSQNAVAAACFVSFLVSDTGQEYFSERTFEYPLVEGIAQYEGLPELASLRAPSIDLSDLASIAETQELLSDIGLLTL